MLKFIYVTLTLCKYISAFINKSHTNDKYCS